MNIDYKDLINLMEKYERRGGVEKEAILLPHIETTIQVDNKGNATIVKIPNERVMILFDLPYELVKDYIPQ